LARAVIDFGREKSSLFGFFRENGICKEYLMNNTDLTEDEKICLQSWFRHAIAKLEQEKVVDQLLKNKSSESKSHFAHHLPVIRRRMSRRNTTHIKELVY
jgi:hypothetical protein